MRLAALASLLLPLLVPGTRAEDEADPSELLRQAVQQIADFNTDRYTEARKADLARYVPAGTELKVTLFYRVVKPAPAEEMEIRVLDDIHPFPVKYLAERGVTFREEETSIVGTGEYLSKGAPPYPGLSAHPQAAWIEWNQWKERSAAWAEERRTSLPPDQYQVRRHGTRENPAGIETHEEPAGEPYLPQVDAAWMKRNAAVLGLAGDALRKNPNAALSGAFGALHEIHARTSGLAWAPEPGGVLLSPSAAGTLGDGLTIERIEYDPGRGQVSVEGKGSVLGLDADLLATTLRLAGTCQEIPYFSLDPHDPMNEEWDAERERVSQELTQRMNSDADWARQFQKASFEVRDHAGDVHRIGFVGEFDPELAQALARRLPMRMDLVFHPTWLARTRLGELLFLADQSLKELWHGAAVWSFAPSRVLKVEGSRAPKFWGPRSFTVEDLEASIGVRVAEESRAFLNRTLNRPPVSSRWWFTPGGQAREGNRVLDLSQVQPVLQTERIGGQGKVTWELQTPIEGLTIKQEVLIDPLASNTEDPWSKEVVEDVNHRFDTYAKAVPEWEALRQVFRAYVFAIWLQKHDPAAMGRLVADLPPPRPASRPLPAVWPDPCLLVVRMHGTGDTLTIEQAAVMGGVGFERPLLRAMPVADARTIPGARPVPLSFLSVKGLVPELSDDAEATPEGYVQWRDRLLKERGFLTAWLFQTLDPREVATFAGLALALCAITWIRARRAKQPLTRTEWVASLVDLAMVTLVLTLVAVYPDTYQHRTGPFTGWHVAVGVYVLIFALADRAGRVGITAVVMTIVMVWTAITPGLGEVARGWTPAQLALPPLEGSGGGPLSTDTIYTLQALQEGLSLCRSVDPHYAWYPLLWLLSVLGVVLEVRVIGERERAARADRAGAAEPHAEGS